MTNAAGQKEREIKTGLAFSEAAEWRRIPLDKSKDCFVTDTSQAKVQVPL
jgi:hypothetical protein